MSDNKQTQEKETFTQLRIAAKSWLYDNSEEEETTFNRQDMLIAFEGGAMWERTEALDENKALAERVKELREVLTNIPGMSDGPDKWDEWWAKRNEAVLKY